jgi:AcrR family transcriptional regulator
MVIKKTRRENILEEAALLFKERGFAATSMRDLAERVGIEAASLYNHIKSKDDILEDICTRIAGEYIAHLTEIEQKPISTTEKVEALIRLHVRIITSDTEGVSVANNEWKHLREPVLTKFKKARSDYEKRFAHIIEQGILNGEFQNLNTSVALFTILSAVRWIELWYKPERGISPQILEETIVSILLNGLKK